VVASDRGGMRGCTAPSDAAMIAKFRAKRVAYERLRDMLLEDDNLQRLADWGVHLDPGGISKPPDSTFPLERYQRYLDLLAEAGGVGASRSGTGACILVWAAGWAGNAQHASFCWMLGGAHPHAYSSRHIEEEWYLEKDF
jgi:hypothetical protein